MTVLDVSGIDFGRTKEISEVCGTSLKFNLDVRWQSQGVIYAVRPLNGSPGAYKGIVCLAWVLLWIPARSAIKRSEQQIILGAFGYLTPSKFNQLGKIIFSFFGLSKDTPK